MANLESSGLQDVQPRRLGTAINTFGPVWRSESALLGFARQDDGTEKGGPIMGVKRFTAAELPIQFVLDQRDALGPSVPLTGAVILSARVDKDGDAMTKGAGDVIGVAHVKVPSSGVRVELSQITK